MMAKKTREMEAVDIDKLPVVISKESKFKGKPTEQVVESVIDELEALIVQRTKEAREFTMRVFWETGKLLRDAEKSNKVSISALVSRIAMDNRIAGRQMGERNLWFALRVYDYSGAKFEALYDTEHGENITVSKLKKLLVTPKPKKNKTLQQIAYDLVDKLGADECQRLIQEIENEIKRRQQKGA